MMIHFSWLWLEESELAYAVGRAVESPPYFWPAFVSCFAWGSGELRLEPSSKKFRPILGCSLRQMIEHHLKLGEKWVEIIKQNQQGQLENIGSIWFL